MFIATRIKTIVFLLMANLLLLATTGCSSTYLDALNPAVDQFNSSANALGVQLNALIEDNDLFQDPTWQSETTAALSDWKAASEALQGLPEPEEEYAKLNSLVQAMASQAILGADAYSAAIATGDIFQMNNGSPYMDQVNNLLPQIADEIARLGQ